MACVSRMLARNRLPSRDDALAAATAQNEAVLAGLRRCPIPSVRGVLSVGVVYVAGIPQGL